MHNSWVLEQEITFTAVFPEIAKVRSDLPSVPASKGEME